ncbi:GNAT family N-acetyltransferase [uncultured Cohaesibacter sp.]|uniref:GNAT family N-acetyltransferase n=1 Tax=uncultured Cohaesibacter sp. TaxID=1002546 RepID=UPI0029C68CA5|nr:GNAT family N-acetyltransferase [uncultured Cohaesibacter sp.]
MPAETPDLSLRPATPDDASTIARLKVICWQQAYKGLLPQASLDRLDAASEATHWHDWLSDSASGLLAYLVEADGVPVGYGLAGPMRLGDREGEELDVSAEIYALYIHPDHLRTGCGKLLLIQLLGGLIAAGHHSCGLWMVADNRPAEAFFACMDGRQARKRVVISHGRIAFREQGWVWDDLRKVHTRLKTTIL